MAMARTPRSIWYYGLLYGLALAAGLLLVQWLEAGLLRRTRFEAWYALGLAVFFGSVGAYVALTLRRRSARAQLTYTTPEAAAQAHGLTTRECEVLQKLAQGLSNAQLAEALFLSEHTVKSHLKHINQKLGTANRTQAVARAQALGILAASSHSPTPSMPPSNGA